MMNFLSSTFLSIFSPPMVSSAPMYNKPIVANYNITTVHQRIKKLRSHTAKTIKFKNSQPIFPETKNNRSLMRKIFKSLDSFICDFIDSSPLPPSIDPHHVLSGNFAQVEELPPTACELAEGSLPSCLYGVYIRNGPNPQFSPCGPYHLFDGDGMLHMIKISNGEATFCSRYVKTYKYTVERDIGHPIFPSAFSSFNGVVASLARIMLTIARVVAKEFDPLKNGFGMANTSVALIGGKLYALGESDLPYEIRVTPEGDVITLGRRDFHASEPFLSMTAHPKIDPETGEAFAFRYHVVAPLLTFFGIDSFGRKRHDVPIFSMKSTALMHDFAVTKNYAIFNDGQMVMSPLRVLRGRQPMRVDRGKIPRLGIIRRDAEDDREMWWIDVQGLNILHAVNAWEEDDGEILVLVGTNLSTVELTLERLDMAELRLEAIRVSVKEKKVVARHPLSSKVHDLAMVNQAYMGKKNRYVYAPVVAHPMMIVGLVKIDLSLSSDNCHDCIVASHMYESGCTGNEPFFVAREPDNPAANEDDGFLVTYIHDENTQESKFLVMDAKSPTLEIVAVVKLPGRVPSGFHGLFVSESQLSKL